MFPCPVSTARHVPSETTKNKYVKKKTFFDIDVNIVEPHVTSLYPYVRIREAKNKNPQLTRGSSSVLFAPADHNKENRFENPSRIQKVKHSTVDAINSKATSRAKLDSNTRSWFDRNHHVLKRVYSKTAEGKSSENNGTVQEVSCGTFDFRTQASGVYSIRKLLLISSTSGRHSRSFQTKEFKKLL